MGYLSLDEESLWCLQCTLKKVISFEGRYFVFRLGGGVKYLVVYLSVYVSLCVEGR